MLILKLSKSIKESYIGKIVRLIIIYVKQECNKYEHVGQEHKLIKEVKSRDSSQEMMQETISKTQSSKDKGSKSRSQSMDEQDFTIKEAPPNQGNINSSNVIPSYVIGGIEEFEERYLNIGGDC
ncbi:hypothetical protein Tco_0269761 [Tanacetum coccineum]